MSSFSNKDRFLDELKNLRRMFHRNPETGFTEFWTTARILEYLNKLNCRPLYGEILYNRFPEPDLLEQWDNKSNKTVAKQYDGDEWVKKLGGKTGAVFVIEGGREGPKIGYRFDIDALPIKESKDDSHIPYREGFNSVNENMHACGHDGHIAIGLGLARKLIADAKNLKGTYYLMFQPAEELLGGGKIFSKLKVVKELDYFFSIHIVPADGKKVICGLSFLADKRYNIMFKGRNSHAGAAPEKGRNALIAACTAATNLYSISRHSEGISRINIGRFVSNNSLNIISDKAEFELDLRGETNEICKYLKNHSENIINGASIMYNVEHEVRLLTEAETSINSKELVAQVRSACLSIGINNNDIIDNEMSSASEDATFIMNEVLNNKGLSTYIGIGSPAYGGHHNKRFDFDENVLLRGVSILHKLAINISKTE